MTDPDLDTRARAVLDATAYLCLGTTDADGRPRVSPVYFVAHEYADLYWVSHPDAHHSHNLARDERVSGVVLDSHSPIGQGRAVYVVGRAREVPEEELAARCPVAFQPERGGRRFAPEELWGPADLRLYVLHVESWEIHVAAGDPEHGTGWDRRVEVVPARGAAR